MPKKRDVRSPLKKRALRVPGQSLAASIDELVNDKLFFWVLAPMVFVMFAVFDWYRAAFNAPPRPWISTSMALLVILLSVWRIGSLRRTVRHMRQGLEGERVVGQVLESLRASGYEVLHDIPGDGHNVDHVLIGPSGVFAIETKTISKPKGDHHVVFDGKSVTVAGLRPDRDPVAQVKAAATEVRTIIQDRAGLELPVRPVLLYPGWFTENGGKHDLWVLNENALPKFLASEAVRLSDAQIRQVSTAIARHVWDVDS